MPGNVSARVRKVQEHNQRRLAGIREACKYGGFSRAKLYRMIAAGDVDAYKEGNLTLIDLGSIDSYFKSLPQVKHK